MSADESAANTAAHLTDPDFVAETLAWCNEKRAENKKPPLARLPHGQRDDGYSCPCGTATGLYVGGGRYGSNFGAAVGPNGRDTPQAVRDFVVAFDRGDLPQYELSPASAQSADAHGLTSDKEET